MGRLVSLVAFVSLLTAKVAMAQNGNWGPWTFQSDSSLVGAGFKHDDGGSLVVACDKTKHIMQMFLIEPRATWHKGNSVKLILRTDLRQEMPLDAQVISPTIVAVKNDTTWGMSMVGKATQSFFTIGNGEYTRTFPTAGFKSSTQFPLQACGDHW